MERPGRLPRLAYIYQPHDLAQINLVCIYFIIGNDACIDLPPRRPFLDRFARIVEDLGQP